ncbi:50S ribosome-binding GTPase [Georgenia soli]|uniref:50S ribosome-binding GTPase n=1 Tax=Georgenia soli TaxID=638953 RepID=A0A2A9EJ15_9MICO|nr:GTPase [Georgenia soli]PFG38586.1 50S ribosome-binding GTPase [Georgenia soli]
MTTLNHDRPEAPADGSAAREEGRGPRLSVVTDLRADVERAAYPLDLPGAEDLRALREQVLVQTGARLLPRLRRASAPAVVVLGGSSGVGKSTVLNSLLGEEVTEAGVLRPTTRRAVVAVHPDDAPDLDGHPLAEMATVVTHPEVPVGLALLDAPDLNSVHADNRALANRLLETADLWVFVTTAARYGDALPWRQLTEAQGRGITTAVVLNRLPLRVRAAVRADLLARMDGLGLGSAPLFVVPDTGPHEGPLDAAVVAELKEWLALVADRHRAAGVVRRTTRGAWAALREQLLALAAGADAQVEAADELRRLAAEAVDEPAQALTDALRNGQAGLGAPTTRWLSLASTGGPLALLLEEGARPRAGRQGRALAARDAAAADLAAEATAALQLVVADGLRGATDGVRRVRAQAALAEKALTASGTTPDRASAVDGARAVVTAWARAVRDAVGDRGADEALSPDGLGALVQAGAAGVAGAAAAVRRLTGGEQLVDTARDDLARRAVSAVRAAVEPYLAELDALPLQPGTALRLRASELKEHA